MAVGQAGRLVAQNIARSAGQAGAKASAQAAAQSAAQAARALAPGMGQMFKQELSAAAIPAAMSLMYYAPAYYESDNPLGSIAKIAALTGTDLLGSAALATGARKLTMGIRPGSVTRDISPQYKDDLASLGLGVGASKQEIGIAKKNVLKDINAGPGDNTAKAAKAAEAKQLADRLTNAGTDQIFGSVYQPSRLANAASFAANYGFSLGGMRAVEEGLINAGAITPTWVQDYSSNPGTVPQDQVIAQQSQNRAEAGVPNQAVTSPGTMSQLSAIEIAQLQDELLAQAEQEYDDLKGVL
jgi:hypothetical protein